MLMCRCLTASNVNGRCSSSTSSLTVSSRLSVCLSVTTWRLLTDYSTRLISDIVNLRDACKDWLRTSQRVEEFFGTSKSRW